MDRSGKMEDMFALYTNTVEAVLLSDKVEEKDGYTSCC